MPDRWTLFRIGAVVPAAAVMLLSPASKQENGPAGPPRPADVVTNTIGMRLVYVPPGEFTMGSAVDEAGRHEDEVQHHVTISRGFYLGVTEVTQAQWQRVMNFNRSETKGDDLPASRLSWRHAETFCRKLGEAEGRTYRLPREAEWEYACRAGTTGPFAGTGKLDEMAWHMDNSGDQPHPVGGMRPNAWGLYDMHGSVLEWCADLYGRDYPAEAVTDPCGPATGTYRVARGGSWRHFARACRSAARASFNPAYQLDQLGLRVLMEPTNNGEGR